MINSNSRRHHLIKMFSVSIMLSLSGCGGEDAHALVEQAKSAQSKGDLKAAVIQLKSAIQADEKNSEARLLLGKLYLARGEYVPAEKELSRARGLGQKPETINPLLAQALMGMREFQRIIDELPVPEENSPVRAQMLASRAQAYLGLKQPEESRKILDEALKAFPSEAELHFAQAKLHLVDRQVDQALGSLDQAIQLEPKQSNYLLLKGEILKLTGKPAEATKIYQAIIGNDPDNAPAHLALATLAIGDKRLDDARKEVETVLKSAPNHLIARYTRALIEFRSNQAAKARDDLAPVLKSAPDYLPANLLAGAVEYSLGSMETAETHLKKVLSAAPGHVYSRRLLAASLLKRGQVDAAEETLKPLDPSQSQDASTLIVAGEIALARKNYPLAEQYFAKASALKPDSAAIRTELGLARMAQGDAQAITDFQASASLDADSTRADTLLIMNHLKRKEFDQALAAISQLEKKMPGSPQPANFRGAALMGKNDPAGARKQFEKALSIDPKYFSAAANLAQLDMKENNLQAAKSRFTSVLKADPKNLNAMLALASIEARAKNESAYLDWLNKAAQADPNAIQPRSLLAQYHLGKKEPAKALALAREAYNANPKSTAALELLGNVQLAAGEKQNAKDSFGKLVELAPNSSSLHYKLAQSLIALNELEPARKNLSKVLELDENHLQARLDIAQLLIKTGQVAEALKQAEIIKRTSPKDPLGLMLEGDILMSQKNFAGALAAYDQAGKIQPGNAILLKQAAALRSSNQLAEADRRLAAWLKTHPDDHAIRLAYAESKIGAGQYADAANHYLYLNQKLPGQLAVLNNLAYAFAQLKDKRAVTYAEQAYKLQPGNASVLDTYGWALSQTGQAAKGVTFLQQALSKAPDSGDIQYHYAAALAANGDKTRAQLELNELLKRSKKFSMEAEAKTLLQQLSSNP